ncbi:MAG: phage baseplate protein [Chloroflexi bacterium]|nr:phage baseplate protein [Chloroflexota bacterium]
MRGLSKQDLLQIWEIGLHQHPVDRALTILAAVLPALPWEELAALSMGQRDGYLLAAWEHTFGDRLESYAECPQCAERLEFPLSAAALRASAQPEEIEPVQGWTVNEYAIQFRLPNSYDLAAIVACADPARAHDLLLSRCVLEVTRDGQSIATDALPATMVSRIAERITVCDPLAEVLLNLECPACARRWQTQFDIAAFFWSELTATARRLLREVHALARAYGWREADILALSAARRQFYLDMVS